MVNPGNITILIGTFTVAVLIGIVTGWVVRGRRCAREKLAVSAGWQEQIEAQRLEHSRLVEQNKSLMEQVNQFQASGKDAANRAREMSAALKESHETRDELQRKLKDVRVNLDTAEAANKRLRSASDLSRASALKAKDDKILRLSRELESWKKRLPPLIERYQQRDEEAKRLEIGLSEAREQIYALESVVNEDETRVESVDTGEFSDGLHASNETINVRFELPSDSDGNGADPDAKPEKPSGGLRDNLKKIKGVGPAIEKTLNELGIFRFHQIAAMSDYDIDRVANRLKGFRSRIYREDWIGQARELSERHENR